MSIQSKGIPLPDFIDGQSFVEGNDNGINWVTNYENRQILIEYWGEGDLTTYNPQCNWSKGDRLSVSILEAVHKQRPPWKEG